MEKQNFSDRNKIVLKVGTESIAGQGYVDIDKIKKVSEDIAFLKNSGKYATIVSSGAIAKGRQMTMQNNGEDIVKKQYLASIGQPELMHHWTNTLIQQKLFSSQFLVDYDDFDSKKKFANLSNVYNYVLQNSSIPIFNENDVLSIEDICFGDNDILASYVTTELKNDLLIMFTTKDGIYRKGKVVPYADSFKREDYDVLEDSECGRGGIESKLKAAERCSNHGIPCIISNISYRIQDILKDEVPRTVFQIYQPKLDLK